MTQQMKKTCFQLRRGKLSDWETINPILRQGEPGFAYDYHILKVGDGISTWNELPNGNIECIFEASNSSGFPDIGNEKVLYKATQEKSLYQWNDETQIYELLSSSNVSIEDLEEKLGDAAWQDVATEISGIGLVDATTVKNYVDAQVGNVHNFDVQVYTKLPTASADTMYIIGLVEDTQASAGSYIEYITTKKADGTYNWEQIGSTKTNLTGYVSQDTQIANVTLDHDITTDELQTALFLKTLAYKDSATGTVDGQLIGGVKASGTTTGSLTGEMGYNSTAIESTGVYVPAGSVTGTVVATGTVTSEASTKSTAAILSMDDYTPEGVVNISPISSTVKSIISTGTAASFTEGIFTPASLTKTETNFAKAGVTITIDENDAEMLVITPAETGEASFVSSFNGGSKAADKFTPNTVIETEDKTVISSIAGATFAGVTSTGLKLTGVTYDKVSDITSTFTGNIDGDSISATFVGSQGNINVSGNYDKANLGTIKFTGSTATFDVDDIIVTAKEVTVE